MAKVYLTASFKRGPSPVGDLYSTEEEAQYHVDRGNGLVPTLQLRVVEVDLADLNNQPPEIRDFVQEQLKFRTRTFVKRAGEEDIALVHPLEADRVNLKEGDKMVQIDSPPQRDEPDGHSRS